MTKENLIGGAVLLVIVGLIGFLVLRPESGDRGQEVNSVEQAQVAQRKSILRPALLSLLEQRERGAQIVSSGQGQLTAGERWRYRNSWPNPNLKVQGADGKMVAIPVSGIGDGGTLWLTSAAKVTAQSATPLARKALNDPKLTVVRSGGRWQLVSRRIVAGSVKAGGDRLTFSGLFSAQACKGSSSASPSLAKACQALAKPRPR